MSVKEPESNRAERRKQQTRARLLKSTEELLYSGGYRPLTIQKITDHADLGYGTFYLHFNNLDDAVWAVVSQQLDQSTQQMIDMLAEEPPRRRVYLGWVNIFHDTQENSKLFLEMYGRGGSVRLKQARQDWLVQIFKFGMEAGHFPPNNTTTPISIQAQYMAGIMSQILSWWVENGCQPTPEEMAATLYRMNYHEPPPDQT